MIRAFAQNWVVSGRHRLGALVLAICLNLAIAPCSMAFEVVEPDHDCCPSEVLIEAAECCVLDDASVDSRYGKMELRDAPDQDLLPAHSYFPVSGVARSRHVASVDPPDPPWEHPPLYDLYCVYLK